MPSNKTPCMPRKSLLFVNLAAVIATVLPLPTSAQTTLSLTYPGSTTPCTFTTDSQGIRLDPATGKVLAIGSFGSGCPNGQTAPSFTNSLTSGDDTVGPIVIGAPISFKWAADADSCSYSASPANVDWSGGACSDTPSCAAVHAFSTTPLSAGTYSFSVTCSKTGNPTSVTSTATITVNSSGGGEVGTACTGIPASLSRQVSGKTTWLGSLIYIASNDFTQFKNVWGRDPSAPSTGPILDWPDRTGILAQLEIRKNSYLSLPFTVPTNLQASAYGTLQGSTTQNGGNIRPWSMTISHSCYGEFDTSSNNLPNTHCVSNNQSESGGLNWSLIGNTAGASTCQLTPGETYFLNIIHAPLTNSDATSGTTSSCNASSCSASINNNYQLQ